MSRDPSALYHRAIVEAAHSGRGTGRLVEPDGSARVDNPLCGDRVTMDVRLRDHRVAAVGHEVRGCLLCEAAASVIARCAPGVEGYILRAVTGEVQRMLQGNGTPRWGDLSMFAPVREYRSRHECVMLPFRALLEALDDAGLSACP